MKWFNLFSIVFVAVYAKEELRGDKVYRITPQNDWQVNELKKWLDDNIKVDVWKEPTHPGQHVDVHVGKDDCEEVEKTLKENKIPFNVMINDVEELVDTEAASNLKHFFSFSTFDYNKYNEWNEIRSELYRLARDNRNTVELFNVGYTYEGNSQLGLKVTNGDGRVKPVIWIDGGIHAREWISPATVMYFLKKLVERQSTQVMRALNKYDFYILPVFNIDGYKYTFKGGRARLWRKTRKPSGWGCYGADPNRNWDSHFGGVGTSSNPCSDIYHGGSAFSEVEVKNVANYLMKIGSNLKSYWNVHAYSQLILTPWSYTKTLPRDYKEIKRVADVFGNAVKNRYGTSYRAGPPSRILYEVTGGSIDWAYEKLGVKYSYALELRDEGRYGFLLPASQIAESGEETTDAILAAVMAMQ